MILLTLIDMAVLVEDDCRDWTERAKKPEYVSRIAFIVEGANMAVIEGREEGID